ncbi:MAG: DUF4271 domain-containing protein [Flavobacteriales bacterium]|nr:DUF4271 domain-containing protein [Flavobacteriales bacterium]
MLLYIPILVSVVLLLIVKVQSGRKLNAIFQGFFDLRAFRRVIREESTVHSTATMLLLINTALILTTSISYVIFQRTNFYTLSDLFIVFGIIAGGLIGYYWLRRVLFSLIGYFTEQNEIANEIQIYNQFFYQVLGLFILPVILFLNYRLDNSTTSWISIFYNGVLLLMQLTFVLVYVYKLIQEFRQTSALKISGYYLFLYFCTLEILPLVAIIMWFIG